MNFRRILIRLTAAAALAVTGNALFTSCIDNGDEQANDNIFLAFNHVLPTGVSASDVTSCELSLTELNSGVTMRLDLMQGNGLEIPLGIYNYEGTAKVRVSDPTSLTPMEKTLRVSGTNLTVSAPSVLSLNWFFSNPGGTLVFSEIYACGSPNATATGGLRDSYLRIYNNTDATIYADGLAICESAFVNARNSTYEILTPANDRNVNFTASTIWVIPGSGKEHPIEPGASLKIADQAIDWSAQVSGALDHTDADFEWYDDNAQDTDNPSVPNLLKWYCYSNTIWILSNQCNRSYALVRFPEGMTADRYLSEYHGAYDYISIIGTQMTNEKAYLIPNEWILDGVNLGNDETYVTGALGKGVDISYASVSTVDKDPNRFGKVFARKSVAMLANGAPLLMDTNDSAADFTLRKAE